MNSVNLGEIFPLILILILLVIFLAIFVPILVVKHKYRKFVLSHSVALKRLGEINNKYQFKNIPNLDMKHRYDNENFYEDISCQDYLTYELVDNQKKVNAALKDTLDNKKLFEKYKKEINDVCLMNQFDTDKLLKNKKRLAEYEGRLFEKQIKSPTISFSIKVRLILTNINGEFRCSKRDEFSPKEIKDIIFKINQKRGNYYSDSQIWESICRVERGKVTNRMRFSIYQRDHYRCQKCGRRTNDLEVDHIIPISKGGKSVYENLQTLCHRCNVRKGAKIE